MSGTVRQPYDKNGRRLLCRYCEADLWSTPSPERWMDAAGEYRCPTRDGMGRSLLTPPLYHEPLIEPSQERTAS